MEVQSKKILWSRQAARQAAVMDLRERRLLIAMAIECYHQAGFHHFF